MANLPLVPKLMLLATALGCGLGIDALQSSTASAQHAIRQSATSPVKNIARLPGISQDDWSFWPSDEERRAPRRTSSGSTRNPSCNSEGLASLTPQDEVGLTGQARPDLLFYVPESLPHDIIFRIQSENGFVHTVPISLSDTAGIVRLPLPEAIPDLPAGEQYLWSVMFLCQEFAGPDSPTLSGWLETEATLEKAMSVVTPSLAQAARYRNNALWYDMISMLANLKLGNPNDIYVEQAWRTVLERHSLEALSEQPIVR